MNKVAFKVHHSEKFGPLIIKVGYDDAEGTSWREAKKQLRSYYLQQAAQLRQITEKEYFNDDPVPQ